MSILLLEAGSNATFDLSFWDYASGTISSSTDQPKFGPRSIKLGDLNASPGFSNNYLSGTAGRISWWIYCGGSNSGAADNGRIFQFNYGNSSAFGLMQTTGDLWRLWDFIAGLQGASYDMSAHIGEWAHIVFCYSRTSSSVNRVVVYVNGSSVIDESNLTWTNPINTQPKVGFSHGLWTDATFVAGYFAGLYLDDDSSFAYPGDIRVTAKLPASDNTVNFDTTVGTGAVNERPLSVTNGQQHAAATDVQENYTLQAASVGDEDLTGATIVGYTGWVWAKRGDIETQLVKSLGGTGTKT